MLTPETGNSVACQWVFYVLSLDLHTCCLIATGASAACLCPAAAAGAAAWSAAGAALLAAILALVSGC